MMMTSTKDILISTNSFGVYDSEPLEMLKREGYVSRLNPHGRKVSGAEFVELIGEAVGLIAGTEKLDADCLEYAKYLKVISRCGVGMDNVDLKTAKRLGIKVINTPTGPTQAVAELVVGLIFNLLRDVTQMDRAIRSGQWSKRMGRLLGQKKLGLIGFGSIGQATARLAKACGLDVYYYDVVTSPEKDALATSLDFNTLLSTVDVVSLHTSFSPENTRLIGAEQLALMKKESYFINAARGGLVDEGALLQSLQSGHLSGAALDVFEDEPYNGPFTEMDNVILTPHIGSYAKEARVYMETEAVKNLIQLLKESGL